MIALYPATAQISDCGRYRYELTREIDPANPRPLVVCGLNPSKATAELDDPTIRKCCKYAIAWGCGRLIMINADAYRATDPKDVRVARKRGHDVCGPGNDAAIQRAVELARLANGIVLVAWGGNIHPARQAELAYVFGDDAMCLKANFDGTPAHPLYQLDSAVPIRWSCP